MKVELLTDVGDERATVYLLVCLEATSTSAAARPPVNLALVIDRSSSMRGPRITHAIEAATQVVHKLDSRDRLSVITFDASARTVFGPANLDDAAKQVLLNALSDIRTGVGTNLAAGIKKGSEAIRSGFVRGSIARLVLLTDGQPSVGITDSTRLAALGEKEASRGVTITTMGIGEGFDDELLAELAARGRGGFHYLATPADIPGAFGRELAGVFAIAARGTQLRLRPSADILSAEVLHRLPSRPMDDGLLVELGEIAAATPRQVLFKLLRRPDGNRHCGTLTITYQQTDGTTGDGHLLGIELSESTKVEHRRSITLERVRLAVATAVDVAWARRASGDNMQALAALSAIKEEVVTLRHCDLADPGSLDALLADIAEAEEAVAKSSAERERARRSMRERSHITLLGHSTIRRLPPGDDE
jgi:Ca-activated chloride channel family protein